MAQYRDFKADIVVSDDDVTIRSTFGAYQIGATVARDGSFETNFKTAIWEQLQGVLSQPPSATSPPCTVMTTGRWNKVFSGAAMATPSTIVQVPAGNSGVLVLHRDAGSFTMKYSLNGGAATTFADGATITAANGDTLSFSVTGLAEQEFAIGSVADQDSGALLDNISFYNTTPAP